MMQDALNQHQPASFLINLSILWWTLVLSTGEVCISSAFCLLWLFLCGVLALSLHMWHKREHQKDQRRSGRGQGPAKPVCCSRADKLLTMTAHLDLALAHYRWECWALTDTDLAHSWLQKHMLSDQIHADHRPIARFSLHLESQMTLRH